VTKSVNDTHFLHPSSEGISERQADETSDAQCEHCVRISG